MPDRLERYRGKRDFAHTAEPRGDRHVSSDGDPVYVVQHHLATADHYDVRLEIDGVLVSWAVPKGPSTDPRQRRLAKRTEDHPLDYENFEGVIAAREYGGGRRGGVVQVWDRGTYRNVSEHDGRERSASEALAAGHLSVVLDGQKLRGGYSFIRTRGENMWLMIKKRDAAADARRRPTSTQTESVLSGRTMDEIAADAPKPNR